MTPGVITQHHLCHKLIIFSRLDSRHYYYAPLLLSFIEKNGVLENFHELKINPIEEDVFVNTALKVRRPGISTLRIGSHPLKKNTVGFIKAFLYIHWNFKETDQKGFNLIIPLLLDMRRIMQRGSFKLW